MLCMYCYEVMNGYFSECMGDSSWDWLLRSLLFRKLACKNSVSSPVPTVHCDALSKSAAYCKESKQESDRSPIYPLCVFCS